MCAGAVAGDGAVAAHTCGDCDMLFGFVRFSAASPADLQWFEGNLFWVLGRCSVTKGCPLGDSGHYMAMMCGLGQGALYGKGVQAGLRHSLFGRDAVLCFKKSNACVLQAGMCAVDSSMGV